MMNNGKRCLALLFLMVSATAGIKAQYVGQHQGQVNIPVKIEVKALSFDLSDSRLLDSRFKDNMMREGKWMLSLPVDRMLHSFYVNAGMFTPDNSKKTKMPTPLGCKRRTLNFQNKQHTFGR
jgi:hypothetical protein